MVRFLAALSVFAFVISAGAIPAKAQAIGAVSDDLGNARHGSANDWQARGHRFEHRVRYSIAITIRRQPTWQNEYRCGAIDRPQLGVIDGWAQGDLVAKLVPCNQRLQTPFLITVADYLATKIDGSRHELCASADQQVEPLFLLEPSDCK